MATKGNQLQIPTIHFWVLNMLVSVRLSHLGNKRNTFPPKRNRSTGTFGHLHYTLSHGDVVARIRKAVRVGMVSITQKEVTPLNYLDMLQNNSSSNSTYNQGSHVVCLYMKNLGFNKCSTLYTSVIPIFLCDPHIGSRILPPLTIDGCIGVQ